LQEESSIRQQQYTDHRRRQNSTTNSDQQQAAGFGHRSLLERGMGKSVEYVTLDASKLDHSPLFTGMSVGFLGTASGSPCAFRNCSSTVVRLGGRCFLFDAGEGTQRQINVSGNHNDSHRCRRCRYHLYLCSFNFPLSHSHPCFHPSSHSFNYNAPIAQQYNVKISSINQIFITHMHGDHLLGLPGVILGNPHSAVKDKRGNLVPMTAAQRADSTVKVFGPPGLYNYLSASLLLSAAMSVVNVIVYEMVGGREENGPSTRFSNNQKMKGVPNVFTEPLIALETSFIKREVLHKQEDGTWHIRKFTTAKQQTFDFVMDL
jgi:ribonuclease BN (tRNA processing enzyme)